MAGRYRWFMAAVMARPPYTLGGWSKHKSAASRRACALRSRPRGWSLRRRYLSAARALQALANVTRDARTRTLARQDAGYFYDMYWRRGRPR